MSTSFINPGLSRFDPLPRILAFDDFDRGFCGWAQHQGNYEDSLDRVLPGYAQLQAPMLSTLPAWDFGSHGGIDGGYALKFQTLPKAGARSCALKRLTFRNACPIRLEWYFTFKPEARELKLGETDVRAFGLLFDLQSGDRTTGGERVMPHIRFLNARDGQHVQKWQFKRAVEQAATLSNKTATHDHMADSNWEDLPGGDQKLCYNEIPTKINWHYGCIDVDLRGLRVTHFRINDRVHDMRGFAEMRMPAWKNLWCMLNVLFFVETDVDKRAWAALDSVCLSSAE
jgi:hypothetical protein